MSGFWCEAQTVQTGNSLLYRQYLDVGRLPARHWWDVEGNPSMSRDTRDGAPKHHGWWHGDRGQVGAFLHGYESLWLPASLLVLDAFALAIIADGEGPAYPGLSRPPVDLQVAHADARAIDLAAAGLLGGQLRSAASHQREVRSRRAFLRASWRWQRRVECGWVHAGSMR